MKRIVTILAFCFLVSALGVAQVYLPHKRRAFLPSQGGGGGPPPWPWGDITNNTDGTLPYAWYVAQYYYTNGSTVVLPDLYTNALHLTNSGSASSWPVYNATLINGNPAIQFSRVAEGNGKYLKNVLFTNNLPHDIWMVMFENGTITDANHPYFDGTASTARQFLVPTATAGRIYFENDSQALVRSTTIYVNISNKWVIVNVKADPAQGFFRTNNVDCTLAYNYYASPLNGLTMGGDYGNYWFSTYNLAEFISYNVTNSAVQRSNIFSYLTNKYSL